MRITPPRPINRGLQAANKNLMSYGRKVLYTRREKEMLALSRQLLAHTREIQERDDFKRIRHIISDGIKAEPLPTRPLRNKPNNTQPEHRHVAV